MKLRRKILYRVIALCGLLLAGVLQGAKAIYADLKSADVFENSQWNLLLEYQLDNDMESLQAICSTDTYIVCFVNASNHDTRPDRLIAFYKNDTDEYGNPVTQYSHAKTVSEMDYEHGNGMTYNPQTNEIIIAGCTALNPENKGCVFVIDAATLQFKRKVQVSTDWNVQAIAYCKNTESYLIQKDKSQGYDFAETDLNFQIVNELDELVDYSSQKAYQDFEVCGNDVICLPYIKKAQYNGNVQVYSRKTYEMLGEYQMDLSSDSEFVEAESIGELSPGRFVLGCAIRNPRRIALYGATLPMAYNIKTTIENGTITESMEGVDLGSDRTIEYKPNENYEVKEVLVDGQPVDYKEFSESCQLFGVTEDHIVDVRCKEIPQFTISTKAVNGTIDPEQLIRRDKDVTISYQPNEHFELERLLVDGKEMDFEDAQNAITLRDIQEAHDIEVEFREILAYEITASVKNGTVSKASEWIYCDEDYTVSFTPDEDYVLKEIYVDGVRVPHVVDKEKFVFANIQREHAIHIVYEWQYRKGLIIIAIAMGITLVGYLALASRRYSKTRRRRRERKDWKKSKDS